MKKRKKKARKDKRSQLHKQILNLFQAKPKQPLSYKQVVKKFIKQNSKEKIIGTIAGLIEKGMLETDRANRLQLGGLSGIQPREYTGIVDLTASGNAYVIVDELEKDVFVLSLIHI